MQRAIKRGEIPASADVNTLPLVIPSMAAYRSLVQRKPFELAFLVSMVDVVVLPALRSPRSSDDKTVLINVIKSPLGQRVRGRLN